MWGRGLAGGQTGRIAPWRFRSRRRRGGGAGSSGRRAGRATASAAGAIALQLAAFWHAGPSGRSWGCHWLGVQRAELASAAVRGRALKIGIANFPRNHAIKRRLGPVAARRPADGQCARSTQTNHSCDWFKDEVRELGVALGFPSAWPIATPSRLRLGRAHLGRKSAWRCQHKQPATIEREPVCVQPCDNRRFSNHFLQHEQAFVFPRFARRRRWRVSASCRCAGAGQNPGGGLQRHVCAFCL